MNFQEVKPRVYYQQADGGGAGVDRKEVPQMSIEVSWFDLKDHLSDLVEKTLDMLSQDGKVKLTEAGIQDYQLVFIHQVGHPFRFSDTFPKIVDLKIDEQSLPKQFESGFIKMKKSSLFKQVSEILDKWVYDEKEKGEPKSRPMKMSIESAEMFAKGFNILSEIKEGDNDVILNVKGGPV